MNLYSFSTLCFSFGVTLIAILVLVKRRDAVAKRFFIFSFSICGWSYLFSIWISQQFEYEASILLARIAYLFVMFIPTTWLHLVFELIKRKEPFKGFLRINYGISSLLVPFCLTDLMIKDMSPFLDFKYLPIGGFLHHFHVTHFFLLVFYGLYCLFRRYSQISGSERDQLRYFVWGTLIGFMCGGTIYVTYYRVPIPMYYLVFLPLYPVLTGIALIKYGLFDVQQIADAFQREKLAAIGTMAASLNHELRNPLYIAKGRIESYLDSEKEGLYLTLEEKHKNADKTLEIAAAHLTRAMDIIQRFSDFAKPFNARKDREKVDLARGFKDVLELVSNEFQMQKIRLRVESVEGKYATVNFRQFEEILFNLIINACHAMEEQGGELTLSATQSGKKTVIEISDTGKGIPEDDLAQIFEPFYSTKGEKGSGLGLYITKQLVEKNGGKIQVESKVGQGTTFRLNFNN